jgi:hypothetical protein
VIKEKKISIVIPCFKVLKHIEDVLNKIPSFIDNVIVIDDCCPEQTGHFVNSLDYKNVEVIFNDVNSGVGGATILGFKRAIEINSDVIVKMDGDNQMDPFYLIELIEPIVNKDCDYTKGNRFHHFSELLKMPKIRLMGNSILSFCVKFSSGYWEISDPTNGYIAFSGSTLKLIDLDNLNKGYFFEIKLLIEANIKNLVVEEIKMPARYEGESSSLSISKIVLVFPFLLLKGLYKRIIYKYFIYSFNIGSIYLLFGLPLFIFGIIFGVFNWVKYSSIDAFTPTGTIVISLLTIILGFQLLIQAITFDVISSPKKKYDRK